MRRGVQVLDVFLGGADLGFLGHAAPGPAPENSRSKREEGGEVVPEGCCPQCYYASGPDCRCGCGGRYHGLGAGLTRLDDYGYEVIADSEIHAFFVGERCLACGSSLRATVYCYDHPEGYRVYGRRLWVFAECPRCGYQNSLAKVMALKRMEEVDG